MENPQLHKVEASLGSEEAMIFMMGYCTEKSCTLSHIQPWIENLREAGWRGAIYYMWWDSSNFRHVSSVAPLLGHLMHWEKHKRRAKCAGEYYLESMISSQVKETSVSLIAHSLGARVIFFGTQNWSSTPSHLLNNIFVLGGAVPSNRDWERVASRLEGKLFNVYNACDPILESFYKISSLGLTPCGLRPIKQSHPKIDNFDATSLVGKSHDSEKYLNVLPKLCQQRNISFSKR
jgi:hypothetical protein